MSIAEGAAEFVASEPLDQQRPELRVAPQQTRLLGDVSLQLLSLAADNTLAEGQTAMLRLSAENLLAGDALQIDLDASPSAELEFSSSRITLTQAEPAVELRMLAVADGVEPEARETIEITARGSSGLEARAQLSIARHGYALTALEVEAEQRAGTPLKVALTLNGEAPVAVAGTMTATGEGSDETRAQPFRIEAGESTGQAIFTGLPAGTWTVTVAEGDAEFESSEPLDQERPELRAPSRQTRLLGDVSLQLLSLAADNTLAEGQTAVLQLSAENLLQGQELRVELKVDTEAATELFLSETLELTLTTVTLTASTPQVEIVIRAAMDGVEPEPRERVEITASAPGTMPDALSVFISRHGYAITTLKFVAEQRAGKPLKMELALNGEAPVAVAGTMTATREGSDETWEQRFRIEAGESTGQATFAKLPAGTWTVTVTQMEFVSSDPLDQKGLEMLALSQQMRLLGDVSLQLVSLAADNTLAEGQTAMLRLSAENLLAGEALQIDLDASPAGELEFSSNQLTLTQAVPAVEITMLAVADGEAPEPRERVEITARGPSGLEASAQLAIARHGYALTTLGVAAEQRAGTPLEVALTLNGVAPVAVAGTLSATREGSGETRAQPFRIEAGDSAGRATFAGLPAGTWTVSIAEGDVEFASSLALDQQRPELRVAPQQTRLLGDVSLQIVSLATDNTLVEGQTAVLRLSAENLLPDTSLQIDLDASPSGELEFSSSRITLTQAVPAVELRMLAVADGMEPEARETIELTALGPSGLEASAQLSIARHGYALTALGVAAEQRAGTPLEVALALNGEAPAAVAGTLSATREGSGETRAQPFRIEAGDRLGQAIFAELPAGTWTVTIAEGDAAFASSEPLDQQRPELRAPSRQTRLLGEVVLQIVSLAAGDTLAEGQTAVLQLSAENLLQGQELRVELKVDTEAATELFLSETLELTLTTVTLTASTPQVEIVIRAAMDGVEPEPRERVEITASAPGTMPDALSVFISRHGYAITTLKFVAEQRAGKPLKMELALNGEAPVAVAGTMTATREGSDETWEQRFRIEAGESTGQATFAKLPAGTWTVTVTQMEFVSSDPLDQKGLEMLALSQQMRLLGDVSLQLVSLAADNTLAEGQTAMLRLSAENLLAGEALQIDLDASPAGELEFSSNQLTLTQAVPSVEFMVEAVADGVVPEPRELVEIRASTSVAGVGLEATVELSIARHGYAITALEVAAEQRAGTPLEVELRLNGEALVAVAGTLSVTREGSEETRAQRFRIEAGDSLGQAIFAELPAGTWTVTIAEGDAAFASSEPLDQQRPELRAPSRQTRLLGEVVLQIVSLAAGDTLEEGQTATLQVSAENLLQGQELRVELEVDAETATELFLSETLDLRLTTVTLTASTPQVEVVMRAHADGLAEPREQVELTASAPGAMPDALSVFIPRHGYRIAALTVAPTRTRLLQPVRVVVEVEINAAAASTLEIIVRATTTGVSVREQFTIPVGSTRGRAVFGGANALTEAGFYTVEVIAASFTQFIGGDQQSLLEEVPSPRAHVTVLPPIVQEPRLFMQLEEALLPEGTGMGEMTVLTVSARNLPAGGRLEVSITTRNVTLAGVNTDDLNPDDVRLSPGHLVLEADARTATVMVQVINDAAPEPRETIELRANAAGAIPGTVHLTIPRDDYAVLSMELSVPHARLGMRPGLIVRLNAPPPALVLISGMHWDPGGFLVPLDWFIDPEEGPSDTVERIFRLRGAGDHAAKIAFAFFGDWEYLDGDQEELEIRQERLEFRVLEEGTLLLLELSGALQGEAAEGSTLSLEVRGVGLESGGLLTVTLEVPEERMEDLRFSTMTFRLDRVSSSRIVEVSVLRDGLPEPREPVQITVTAQTGERMQSREVDFAIPRHGYAVESLGVEPGHLSVGGSAELRLEWNARCRRQSPLC